MDSNALHYLIRTKCTTALRSTLHWKRFGIGCLPWLLLALPDAARAQWVDDFDTINPAWVTDRYEPAAFQSAPFLGDNRLQITVDQTGSTANRPPAYSSSFFNTQGRQRPGEILGDWSLSAEVYVPSSANTTTGQLMRTDLWVHTGTMVSNGAYAVIGFTNASPLTPLDPTAPDRSFRFQVFDGTASEPDHWVDVGVPSGFTFDTWHTLEASDTGIAFEYRLDGVVVFSDPTGLGANLQTAFIEAYNFGQTGTGLDSYSVYWDHAVAAVPEPAMAALALGIATLSLYVLRRCNGWGSGKLKPPQG